MAASATPTTGLTTNPSTPRPAPTSAPAAPPASAPRIGSCTRPVTPSTTPPTAESKPAREPWGRVPRPRRGYSAATRRVRAGLEFRPRFRRDVQEQHARPTRRTKKMHLEGVPPGSKPDARPSKIGAPSLARRVDTAATPTSRSRRASSFARCRSAYASSSARWLAARERLPVICDNDPAAPVPYQPLGQKKRFLQSRRRRGRELDSPRVQLEGTATRGSRPARRRRRRGARATARRARSPRRTRPGPRRRPLSLIQARAA